MAGSRQWLAGLFFWILVLPSFSAAGWAQVAASITGKVDDASGAAVSGATVTMMDMETGAKRVVQTDSSGNYHILSLPIGVYELSVEKSGFATTEWTGIHLNVGAE